MTTQPKGTEAGRGLEAIEAFLMGEAPLDGLWFGEKKPVMGGKYGAEFWWRSQLRAVLEALRQERDEARITIAAGITEVGWSRRERDEARAELEEVRNTLSARARAAEERAASLQKSFTDTEREKWEAEQRARELEKALREADERTRLSAGDNTRQWRACGVCLAEEVHADDCPFAALTPTEASGHDEPEPEPPYTAADYFFDEEYS